MAIDKPQISFNLIPEKQVEAAIANDYTRIDWTGRSTKNIAKATGQIRESIAQGIREGKDYSQMANAVSDRMGKSAADMQRIARTEGHRARERGNLDSLQYAHEKGLNLEKEWVSALDERTRDAHAILDGETVGVNEDFISPAGGRGQGPGLMGNGGDDVNCRCTLVGVTPGEKFEYRGYRYDDAPGSYIGKYSNYMNWAEKKGIKPHLFTDVKPKITTKYATKYATSEEWLKSLNDDQRKTVDGWVKGDDYTKIRNQQVTGKGGISDDVVAKFAEAVDGAPRYNGTTYRGLSELDPSVIDKMANSKQITFDAFTSTDKKWQTAEQFAFPTKPRPVSADFGENGLVMEIIGKSGRDISAVGFHGEQEVLFRAGTTFDVVSVSKHIYSPNDKVVFTKIILKEVP